MKGAPRRMRKQEHKTSSLGNGVKSRVSSSAAKQSVLGQSRDSHKLLTLNSRIKTTPKRGRGRPKQVTLTSTPVRISFTETLADSSGFPPSAKKLLLHDTESCTQAKTTKGTSLNNKTKACCKKRSSSLLPPRKQAAKKTQANGFAVSSSAAIDSTASSPVTKRRRGRPRKTDKQNLKDLNWKSSPQTSERLRPKFELQRFDAIEQEDSLLSSDLSIELSHYEEQLPALSFEEDEKSGDEDEYLPSFLMQESKKPPSITEGGFVWCKLRSYPFWPALVKGVNQKQKKASIMFVDEAFTGIQKNRGFTVSLKTLKPYDCEEADELICKAKESYGAALTWSLEFIQDYRMRIACGSFSGSFIQYCNHDMSYPVRRKYPQATSDRLTISSEIVLEEPSLNLTVESSPEKHEDVCTVSKRLLPDRTHAAHNRANEKLVHFIVKQRMVEPRLLAVIRGQQQSRWLSSFLSAKRRRRLVNIYLEDDQQLDQVYLYLNELYAKAVTNSPCLEEVKSLERVPFVLDVLLPEAIIHAIAGVDNVSVKKAEEKYLKGRCISNRERQEFDHMIEQQMRRKSQHQKETLELLADLTG